MRKIILVNGAPRSGKDTFAEIAEGVDGDTYIESFKHPMLDAVRTLFGISYLVWEARYTSDDKDKPWDLLHGMSQRESLIWLSEEVAKPKFGKDFFGKSMISRLTTVKFEGHDTVIIPDSGFTDETQAVVDHFGADMCVMINIFRDGCTFDNDSRGLVTGEMLGIKGYEIQNNDTFKMYSSRCKALYKEILNGS